MKSVIKKILLGVALLAIVIAWNGKFEIPPQGSLCSIAEAVVGRPATPISYAGVARRTPIGPGGNTRYNRGGPVNRVGRR
ncbi:hypothetical protein [Desulfogranum marinum]|uniref:hypothetical protein n=1 Tax=Desulfogranum marinum TaxID=453220 RepID=UPI0029C8FF86|nr:hypothetical protein [Desulfogranum marinum]